MRKRRVILLFMGLWGCSGSQVPVSEWGADFGDPFVSLSRLKTDSPILGLLAEGVVGDWLLENERFRACISGLGHPRPPRVSGGNILDIAAEGSSDAFRAMHTSFDNAFPRQAVYTALHPGPSDSLTVSLIATGHDSFDPSLRITTAYRLAPGSDRLEIETRLINTGVETWNGFGLGDALEWGRVSRFAPGYGSELTGMRLKLPWLGGMGLGTALIYQGEKSLTVANGISWSDPMVKSVTLAPGDTVAYKRWIVVAAGGVAAAHRLIPGAGTERVSLDVTDPHGVPLPGCLVTALDGEGRPLLVGRTRADGRCVLRLPPGSPVFVVEHPERGRRSQRHRLRLGKPLTLKVKLQEAAVLHLQSRAKGALIPAKWILEGRIGTQDPNLGPGYDLSGAGNVVYSPGGTTETRLPAGTYRLTCVHGLRHEMWQTEVSLRPGEELVVQANLTPLPFPAGWVSADLHAPTLPDLGSIVTSRDRLLAHSCEGIDWVTTTEVDSVNNREAPRFKKTVGHANPGELLQPLRARIPQALIQVNHPRAGRRGSLDWFAYDPKAKPSNRPMPTDFDLIEVLNGNQRDQTETVWTDWVELLKHEQDIVGVGNSDAFDLINRTGGTPRTLIRVAHPDSERFVVDGLRLGRAQVSNGPLIDFVLEGASLGETVESDGNTFAGHLRVVAGSWVDVSRVEIFVNGRLHSEYRVRESKRPIRFDEDILVRTMGGGRAFVQVRVSGERSLGPMASLGDEAATPLAFTNPVWVEVPFAAR